MREGVVAAIVDDILVIVVIAAAAILLAAFLGFSWLLAPVLAIAGLVAIALVKGVKAQLRKPLVGLESMIGSIGVVVESGEETIVNVNGELWKAICRGGCRVGQRVRVVGFNGLTLIVEPVDAKG